ncbi:MAG TPA: sensor histidine kinase [Gaiellaceae bacterium]|nr:sensor histidine kinase [Gaiellaceae bacterium]
MNRGRLLRVALFALAVVLAVAAVPVLHPSDPAERIAVTLLIGVGFVAAGLIAWERRPLNGLGKLMTLLGFALLARKFQFGDPGDWTFTAGFLVRDIPWVVFGHIVLAYPTGTLTRRRERSFAVAAYSAALLLPLAALLVHEAPGDDVAGDSAIAVAPSEEAFDALRQAEYFAIYGLLPMVLLGLIGAKLAEASPRARKMYAPLLLFGVILAIRGLVEAIFSFGDPSQTAETVLFWTGQGMEVALGLALLVSVFRVIKARATLADALAELHGVSPTEVRAALARALRDPELDVAFWMPERQAYVDASGARYEFPVNDPRRAITGIKGAGGEPIAALVHDAGLENEPALVRDAAAAARLALENARLQAELRAQLALVQESRARIVAAGDEERRRIERDLHDGAQQRLVALGLELRAAQRRLGADGHEVGEVLGAAVDELQRALDELRELAHGLHPSVLTQNGLGPALQSLAARTPVPIEIDEAPAERLPAPVEATAYFVACEAVANAVKHARASRITITAVQENGRLVVEVADDGVGGADRNGSGLRGLADRLEARGGRLRVESRTGEGTKVIGELPCES